MSLMQNATKTLEGNLVVLTMKGANGTEVEHGVRGNYFGGWDFDAFINPGSVRTQSFQLLYFLCLLALFCLAYKIIKVWKILYVPETAIAILLGALLAFLVVSTGYRDIANTFDAHFFFYYLLPPLIFQAGYTQDRKAFFSNWLAIWMFANLGTVISTLVFGYGLYLAGWANLTIPLSFIECLSFGALVSATDPVSTLGVFNDLKVEPVLLSIVYGSSAIDDAVALIMFRTFTKYIGREGVPTDVAVTIIIYLIIALSVSLVIGSALGALAALIIKKNSLSGQPKVILCLVFCFVYISYFTCTVLQGSGIISCMFAAISFRYYLEVGSVVSDADFVAIDLMLSFVSYFVETVVFFCIGMSTITMFRKCEAKIDVRFVLWSLFLATVSRIAFVYPLSYIINLMNRKISCCCSSSIVPSSNEMNSRKARRKSLAEIASPSPSYISMNEQHMIVFAGLRGPIAYAAAQLYPTVNPNHNPNLNLNTVSANIRFATLVIVLSNIFINGSLTELALKFFGIQYGDMLEEDNSTIVEVDPESNISNTKSDVIVKISGTRNCFSSGTNPENSNSFSFEKYFRIFETAYILPLFQERSLDE